ncbi:helix-turn-helix domain-containing protein [Dysgonomonas termitidis]|uniref:Helix-turn-helix domain-containing protein n=1 Tax=Dysgonomonas termitidis TaxID=1516126 RepID=A0ABV9L379_9BACT
MFQQFLKLLFKHYKEERSIKYYASKLYFTPKHLARIVKEASDRAASEWIDEMVIMTTKALLKSSNRTVAQIPDELNFANSSFFRYLFQKKQV